MEPLNFHCTHVGGGWGGGMCLDNRGIKKKNQIKSIDPSPHEEEECKTKVEVSVEEGRLHFGVCKR